MKTALLALLLLMAGVVPARAQIKASEKASVTQIVNGVTITLEYYRPLARGRDSLFGKVVHWGETWTPGANWASTFEADHDVVLNGQRVPKGKHSVWMITARDSAWTVFLHKNPRVWHTRRPKGTNDDIVRFKVEPMQGPHMEALTWYFPTIERESAALHLHWGTLYIPLRIDTEPARREHLTAAEQERYVGEYVIKYERDDDEAKVRIYIDQGNLMMVYLADKPGDEFKEELIPLGNHRFASGRIQNGQLVEVNDDVPLTFQLEAGRPMTFDLYDEKEQKAVGKGRRIK